MPPRLKDFLDVDDSLSLFCCAAPPAAETAALAAAAAAAAANQQAPTTTTPPRWPWNHRPPPPAAAAATTTTTAETGPPMPQPLQEEEGGLNVPEPAGDLPPPLVVMSGALDDESPPEAAVDQQQQQDQDEQQDQDATTELQPSLTLPHPPQHSVQEHSTSSSSSQDDSLWLPLLPHSPLVVGTRTSTDHTSVLPFRQRASWGGSIFRPRRRPQQESAEEEEDRFLLEEEDEEGQPPIVPSLAFDDDDDDNEELNPPGQPLHTQQDPEDYWSSAESAASRPQSPQPPSSSQNNSSENQDEEEALQFNNLLLHTPTSSDDGSSSPTNTTTTTRSRMILHLSPPPPPRPPPFWAPQQHAEQQQDAAEDGIHHRGQQEQRQRRLLPLYHPPHRRPISFLYPPGQAGARHQSTRTTAKKTIPLLQLDAATTTLEDLQDYLWAHHQDSYHASAATHSTACTMEAATVLEELMHALVVESRSPRLHCLGMQLLVSCASPPPPPPPPPRHSSFPADSFAPSPPSFSTTTPLENPLVPPTTNWSLEWSPPTRPSRRTTRSRMCVPPLLHEHDVAVLFSPKILEWVTQTLLGESLQEECWEFGTHHNLSGSQDQETLEWWRLSQEYAALVVQSLTVHSGMVSSHLVAPPPPPPSVSGTATATKSEASSSPPRLLEALAQVLLISQQEEEDKDSVGQPCEPQHGGRRDHHPWRTKGHETAGMVRQVSSGATPHVPPNHGLPLFSTPPRSPPIPQQVCDSQIPLFSSTSPSISNLPMVTPNPHTVESHSYPPRRSPVTEQARIHAANAIMNLSSGPATTKAIMASCPPLLLALKTILLQEDEKHVRHRTNRINTMETLRFKAITAIKNLSNLERNDEALVQFPGLVQALGHVVLQSTLADHTVGATDCTSHACTVLMNLSVSKRFKCNVYHAPGVMQALLTVLARTEYISSSALRSCLRDDPEELHDQRLAARGYPPRHLLVAAYEARVRTCSVLSNLAIGYDNKLSMFHYPGLVEAIVRMIVKSSGGDADEEEDDWADHSDSSDDNDTNFDEEIRSKACSVIWSLAAEKENQVPMVAGDQGVVVPVLIHVARESFVSDSRQKCVAALTLLAESSENALPLIHAGLLPPLLDLLQQAGSDPTQWKDPTASWCVSCLMNLAQVHQAVPFLHQAGAVQSLAPLVIQDQQYQSLKAAMAVILLCYRRRQQQNQRVASRTTARNRSVDRCDAMVEDDPHQDDPEYHYTLLRQTESAIPQMVLLLYNTLARRGGEGYKYGVFTLSSSVACMAAVAGGPEFLQEHVCGTKDTTTGENITTPVLVSLLQVLWDFAVDGGIAGTIVGGGRDDVESAQWALEAVHSIVVYLRSHVPMTTRDILPSSSLAKPLLHALQCTHHRFAAMGRSYRLYKSLAAHTLELIVTGGDTVHDPMKTEATVAASVETSHGRHHRKRTKKRKQPGEATLCATVNSTDAMSTLDDTSADAIEMSRNGSPVSVMWMRHHRSLSASPNGQKHNQRSLLTDSIFRPSDSSDSDGSSSSNESSSFSTSITPTRMDSSSSFESSSAQDDHP